jgi:hypothetical protein
MIHRIEQPGFFSPRPTPPGMRVRSGGVFDKDIFLVVSKSATSMKMLDFKP